MSSRRGRDVSDDDRGGRVRSRETIERRQNDKFDKKRSKHSRSSERSKERRKHDDKSSKKSKHSSRDREKPKKSHKKRSKRSSSSSSSSSSNASGAELKLLQRLQDERLRQVAERKKQRDALKSKETPEEKRARRIREKREKEKRRRERMGWDGEYQHYTNQDNPFGDAALTQTFVWNKKLARDGLATASTAELDMRNKQKQMENKLELEKVKKRRIEREAEREAREDEALALQRGREAAQWQHWRTLEDAFHLKQARLRSQIRIQDGRAKAIDLLAWYVSAEGEIDAVEMHEPYTYLNGLHIADLEDLLEDIKVYKELENNENHSYWSDITTIVMDELEKLRRAETAASGNDGAGDVPRRDGIHHAIAQDVTQVFKGKTGTQLEVLQKQIEEKIQGRHDGVDIGYWESLLSQLKAHMARARLRDRHQQNLRRKLQLLKEEQGMAIENRAIKLEDTEEPEPGPSNENPTVENIKEEDESNEEWESRELDITSDFIRMYDRGHYSPVLLDVSKLDPGTVVIDPNKDDERIEILRGSLLRTNEKEVHPEESSGVIAALEREARRDMDGDEVRFSVETPVLDHLYLWSDKYRPRKPRYFNRVHTGFEWNKYNQTHYDMDNPPPKIVQGYKFNIFYPDLIDKNSTPEFSLKPCMDNPDFGVLRFHAGPPYEDIAFKIVNREWEYSYKRGFRCQFQNNIFQLWFHFKRYRYRR